MQIVLSSTSNFDISVSERGDDIFEAEHLPSYARTYILPRKMQRKKKEEEERSRKNSVDSTSTASYTYKATAISIEGAETYQLFSATRAK